MIAPPLYLICLAIELIYVLIRFIVVLVMTAVLGHDGYTAVLVALGVATFPLVWSAVTLLGVPGGWGLMWELGARRPSRREKATVKPILAELRRQGARRPMMWFVVDDPTPNAEAIGRTIYIRSSLIDHPSLAAVLAHECGHMGILGSQMLLALTRLEFPGLRALRVYFDVAGDRVLAWLRWRR